MKVRDLIQQNENTVHEVGPETTVAEAARAMIENNIGSVLIAEDGRAIGIFTKNDLLRRYLEDPGGFGGKAVVSRTGRKLCSTTPDADLTDVFGEMVERGIHHMPVIEDGKAVGMLTPIDVLLHLKEAVHYENKQLLQYIHGSY
jgi:CBS domain-containing protein